MVTPNTSVQTYSAKRDDLSRRHYATQDLFARENTADKTAGKLADEFTKAFSDALKMRGYRPIVGSEIEMDIMNYDGSMPEGKDSVSIYKRLQAVTTQAKPDSHFDHADGYVSQEGAYPLRKAYLDAATYPELTTPPADLVRGSHLNTLLKRQIVRAANRYSQRHAILGEKLPILRDDFEGRKATGQWSDQDEERYRIIENEDDQLMDDEKKEIRAAGPLSAFEQKLAHALFGTESQFGTDYRSAHLSEHINFSLHAPHDKNALFDPNNLEGTPLDLHENNLFAGVLIAIIFENIITKHSADDFALLYAGDESMKRLRQFATIKGTSLSIGDMRNCSSFRNFDTRTNSNIALDEKQSARIEYKLPGSACNSHLAMLQVASFMYMGARAIDDIYGPDAKYDHLPFDATHKIRDYMAEIHNGDAGINPFLPDFENHIIDRFQQGGLLEASVHCMAEDIRKDDPARADDLEAKYANFKEAVIERVHSLSKERMGLDPYGLGPLR